jgi:hypothetical protein
MGIEKYNEKDFNIWCEKHAEWMRKNLPVQMVESFENELESLLSDKDRHGFMLFHLLHMSTLNQEEYMYSSLAQTTWDLALPMVQAFNTMMMSIAQRAGDEKTFHAIALSNALMMQMFSQPKGDEEE